MYALGHIQLINFIETCENLVEIFNLFLSFLNLISHLLVSVFPTISNFFQLLTMRCGIKCASFGGNVDVEEEYLKLEA